MTSLPLTLSEAFREAFIHDRHVIMGRKMQPFCIDHLMSLEALNSPLIMGGQVKIEDAQAAIKLCSTASDQDYFDASLRPDKYWKKWSNVTRSYPLAVFVASWDDYIEDFSPKFEQFRYEDQDAPKCPGYILTAAKLVERGHDPAKVRRMGLGEVTAWALAIMENNPTPHNPNPLKGIKDDWDVMTAREQMMGGQ
jgi:hypothetical protein